MNTADRSERARKLRSFRAANREQARDLIAILDRQMDREVNARRKSMVADRILDGESPAVQKILVRHIKRHSPETHLYMVQGTPKHKRYASYLKSA